MRARPTGAAQAVALLLALLEAAGDEQEDRAQHQGHQQNPEDVFHGRQDNR